MCEIIKRFEIELQDKPNTEYERLRGSFLVSTKKGYFSFNFSSIIGNLRTSLERLNNI